MEFGKIENVVEAKFRIVTPMFLGGADQSPSDGIRPPSVKGALRFWWRALNWSTFRGEAADDKSALCELHKEEARLFGSAADNGKGGQGIFLLSIKSDKAKELPLSKLFPDLQCKNGSHDFSQSLTVGKFSPRAYMLGMGLTSRNALNGEFELRLRFRESSGNEDRESVMKAVEVFGFLGGLGSRTRRGWGSVALCSIEGVANFKLPSTIDEYKKALCGLTSDLGEPPFSAFSGESRFAFLRITPSNPLEVIDAIGLELGRYRGWGKGDKVFGVQKEPGERFKSDHDNMKKAALGEQKLGCDTTPDRLVFGMPHNYFFSSIQNGNKKVDIPAPRKKILQCQETSNQSPDIQRRASPLMVHVHPVGNEYVGVLLKMQSKFLPVMQTKSKATIEAKGGRTKKITKRDGSTIQVPCPYLLDVVVKWERIDEFMGRDAFKGVAT